MLFKLISLFLLTRPFAFLFLFLFFKYMVFILIFYLVLFLKILTKKSVLRLIRLNLSTSLY